MNCKSTKIVISTLVLVLSSTFVFAQNPERIDFIKEGSNSLVWEEKMPAKSTKDFVFKAKKGQILTLSYVDDTNQGSMDLGKVSIEPNTAPYKSTIEVTKDYRLSVSNNSNKQTSIRISISLEDAKKDTPDKKEKVRFAKGTSSTTLTRTIDASGSLDFIMHARKGQKMNFTIGYDFKDTDVEGFLTEPNLQDISLTAGPKTPNEFVINTTGNHRLTVHNTTSKKITITLYLDIE